MQETNAEDRKKSCYDCGNFNQHYAIATRGKRFLKINCGNCIKYKEREEIPKRIKEGIEKSLAEMAKAVCKIAEVVKYFKYGTADKDE